MPHEDSLVMAWLKAAPSLCATLAVAMISWKQWAVARAKLRLDLYDRRYRVYKAVKDLHAAKLDPEDLTNESIAKFLEGTSDVDFLFDDDVVNYVEETRRHAQKYLFSVSRMRQLRDEDRRDSVEFKSASAEFQQHLDWLLNQVGHCKKPFLAYLSFGEVKESGPGPSTRD